MNSQLSDNATHVLTWLQCPQTKATLAIRMGCHERDVRRAIEELRSHGWEIIVHDGRYTLITDASPENLQALKAYLSTQWRHIRTQAAALKKLSARYPELANYEMEIEP